MSIELIDTSVLESDYTQRVTLDGTDYILRLLFNARPGRWFIDVLDEEESPILSGFKLSANEDILALVIDDRKPPGSLVAMHYPSQNEAPETPRDPGIEQLGQRVILTYIEADTLAELVA